MNATSQSNLRFSDLAVQDPIVAIPPRSTLPSIQIPAGTEQSTARAAPALPPLPTIPTSHIWGIDFHSLTMAQSLEAIERWIQRGVPGYAITANLNYAMLYSQIPRLATLTRQAALVLCDGMPIYWRSLWNEQPLPERVAGSDLIVRLAELSSQRGYRIYFYGAAEGVAQRTADLLVERFPGLVVAGVQCPSFGPTTDSEKQASLDHIRSARPDILLVALGQPKGEYWIDEHYQQLGVPLSIQVGASFDFLGGNAKRAPRIWQRTGLEWLYRACTDPKRLGPRYAKNLLFLLRSLRRECINYLS